MFESRSVIRRLDDNGLATGPQSLADTNEEGAKHGLLAVEVAVNGRPADPDGSAEVFERHPGEATPSELLCGGVEQGLTAVGLGETAWRWFGHGLSVDIPVNHH